MGEGGETRPHGDGEPDQRERKGLSEGEAGVDAEG